MPSRDDDPEDLERLRAELAAPDTSESRAHLVAATAAGDLVWEPADDWTEADIRRLVRLVIRRIVVEVVIVDGHYQQSPTVELHPFFAAYTPPPFPATHVRNRWTRVSG